jgi:hypothetical protein
MPICTTILLWVLLTTTHRVPKDSKTLIRGKGRLEAILEAQHHKDLGLILEQLDLKDQDLILEQLDHKDLELILEQLDLKDQVLILEQPDHKGLDLTLAQLDPKDLGLILEQQGHKDLDLTLEQLVHKVHRDLILERLVHKDNLDLTPVQLVHKGLLDLKDLKDRQAVTHHLVQDNKHLQVFIKKAANLQRTLEARHLKAPLDIQVVRDHKELLDILAVQDLPTLAALGHKGQRHLIPAIQGRILGNNLPQTTPELM